MNMDDETKAHKSKNGGLFHVIATQPWIFLSFFPILLTIFTAVGFTRDNYIEDQVGKIWIPTSNQLAKDNDYLENIGAHAFGSSSFAAMAIARDGRNLFTGSRLEEIRKRMDSIEAMTVEMNSEVFTWEDICASNSLGAGTGTTYRWPCARLSPMDLFQETRSYFNEIDRLTWYHGVVKSAAIHPRILRFGVMQQNCITPEGSSNPFGSSPCDVQAALRMNPDFAESKGYPREYANPLGLISDVGSLELNHICRICIEESFEAQMDQLQKQLVIPFFTVLGLEFRRFQANLTDAGDIAKMEELASRAEKIASNVGRGDVEDFFYYQVLRQTYAELGAANYMNSYNSKITPQTLPLDCSAQQCPPFNITLQDAKDALFRHADNAFSSISTPGSPLPLWSESDGTGSMFAGTNPVSGSGIDMSGELLHAAGYIDMANYGKPSWQPLYSLRFADPLTPDPLWGPMVETNPVYAWFMAAETPMTAHCGNGNLTGASLGIPQFDRLTAQMAIGLTQKWCTKYNVPFEANMTMTKQHFGRMWYDLLLDSNAFLGLTQGEDDPYTWTLGTGCGYQLGGERYPYTNESESAILSNASRDLYFIDEGASIGVVDRNLLMGDVTPDVGKYNFSNPLREVGVIQSLYASLAVPSDIVQRLKNCNRPGGPVNISSTEAEKVLKRFKEQFDNVWTVGWDDSNAGDVQFVSFSDDVGVIGTTGEFLREITLANGLLTALSIVIIAVFSVFLMFSFDPVESKVLVTLFGVALVILSYFASLGFAILIGIKLNVSISWTLPFILVGLGVDDMYIVLLALKKQKGYSERCFLNGMSEVVIPVTMTSLTNAAMFAIMNISDVPAVYLTARVALIAVCFLYFTIIFSFPAFCYLDMRRQEANRFDVAICVKAEEKDITDVSRRKCVGSWLTKLLYDNFFRPVFLGEPAVRFASNILLWAAAIALLAVAIWGITEREVGLGLEDFFPSDHYANKWATVRTENLASWPVGMNWGALEYGDPDTQMKMISQFERVVEHPNIAEVDTKRLWIADFAVWTTRQCDDNVARSNPEVYNCGRDQIWPEDNSTCSGSWKQNVFGLREKFFNDGIGTCNPFEGGICRPTSQMHPKDLEELGTDPQVDINSASWCPVFEGWPNEKLGYCIKQWRFFTGGGGNLLLKDEHGLASSCAGDYYNTERIRTPIPYSSGPTMFAIGLFSHDITIEMIKDTQAICDNDEELHCFVTGIPMNYWSQYIGIFSTLIEVGGTSIAIGFAIAALFLFLMLNMEGNHPFGKNLAGSVVGSFLIAINMVLSLVTVVGISILAGVNITGFSLISFVLSVGFSVEYAVHVVHRWMHAPMSIESSVDRVDYAMSFLMLPTFMSFVSSTIGVATLAFTQFDFTQVFFFRPLIIVMPVTYFYGCWWLPVLLSLLDFDFMKLGGNAEDVSSSPEEEKKERFSEEDVPLNGEDPTATDTRGVEKGEIET